jgi:hypothetical protein
MLPVCPSLALLTSLALLPTTPPTCNLDPSPAACAHPRAPVATMARVYAEVNQNMPRSYWDYDSVNIGQSSRQPPLKRVQRLPSISGRWLAAWLGPASRPTLQEMRIIKLTRMQAGEFWKTTRSSGRLVRASLLAYLQLPRPGPSRRLTDRSLPVHRPRQILRGVRGHQCHELPEMRRQGPEAR